jgi:tetratricopeptide (TPR) repeat protein
LPATRAQLALLVDDREQIKAAVDRSLGIDPDDPTALEARANYKAGIQSDLDGALADLTRAAEIAPGSSSIWNAIGNVQSSRNAEREAEAAFKRAIELDPYDPVSYANLAILYLDQDRVKEAKALIDKAMAVDPSFDIALVARGRYHLQTGEMDKAMQDLLAGSTANPAYAQALLLLAGGYYESGQREPAEQALENADRLDPNDPVTTSVETAIAIDDYDSDRAIESAQETLRRARARGGNFASLSANRDAGSLLNEAFRLQGLDAWGRYYGDVTFDPFAATGYIDQALAGSADSFAIDLGHGSLLTDPESNNSSFSAFFQGLMLDPLMLSGRSRTANLFRRPFVEGSVGGGFINNGENGDQGQDWGWTTEGEVQGYIANPVPWSFYAKVDAERSDDFRQGFTPGLPDPTSQFDLQFQKVTGTGYIAVKPTPSDRVVAYVNLQDHKPDLLDGVSVVNPPVPVSYATPFGFSIDALLFGGTYDRTVEDKAATAGVGWSHTFGYRNVMNAAVFATGFDRNSNESGVLVNDTVIGPIGVNTAIESQIKQTSYLAAVNHAYGVGDLTLRYGIEGGTLDYEASSLQTSTMVIRDFAIPPIPLDPITESQELNLTLGRAYIDALYEITEDLKVEAAAFGTSLEGDSISTDRFEPRIGVAWAPTKGQWLRASFMRESAPFTNTTLSPIGVLGLQSNQVPLALDGYSDTFIARWDAEWTSRLFTTVDYQHQELTGISIPQPATIDTLSLTDGSLDRVSATANVWLGHGFGVFGTIAWLDSKNKTPGFDGSIPLVPDMLGRMGVSWVNPINLKVTLAATYVGERDGDLSGTTLAEYWTADAFLTWEPFDKRFELDLAAYNLFDQEFEVAPAIPGWGRSVVGSLKVRF